MKNVFGEPLKSCCESPITGFFRDGFCRTNRSDFGKHIICAVVDDEFLAFSKSKGNDLSSVVKEGENLYRISLLHNIKMATLQEWNNLENTGAIIAGQTLWLVPPSMQEE
mgnify:CR=1 FL=1